MKKKDTFDVLISVWAAIGDAFALFGGFMFATWVRFGSGWIPVAFGTPKDVYAIYAKGACFATALCMLVFRSLDLYVRPQMGSFANKIPRLVRAIGIGILLTTVAAFAVRNVVFQYSTMTLVASFFTVSFLVLLERYIAFRIEWNVSRHSTEFNNVLILGIDSVAAHLRRTLKKEPMLRSKVIGFLNTTGSEHDKEIPAEQVKGTIDDLESFVAANKVDQVILTDSSLGHNRIVDIIMLCDRNLITLNMVPDLFRIMTSSMDVQSLNEIPLLGIAKWPLDLFWNRALKRAEDIVGASIGLLLAGPVIGIAAALIKKSSPGPVFYMQDRCGEDGKVFKLYKLRTMSVDAEKETGPVWAKADEPAGHR